VKLVPARSIKLGQVLSMWLVQEL